jgi:transposase-like protein
MTRPDNNRNRHPDDRSVLSIIRDIHQGAIEAKNLTPETRRRCVEHFTGEGYSVADIAEILKVTERTIGRDRAAIRKINAVERDPEMTAEIVGQLILQADICIQHIRRVTRERATPPNVRVDGEKACWVIFRDFVQRLQTLGHLPTAPQEIRGELTHQIEQLPGFGQMKEEVARLETIVITHAIGEENLPLLKKFAEIKEQVKRGALYEDLAVIQQQLPNDGETIDESDHQRCTEGDAARDQRASTQGG